MALVPFTSYTAIYQANTVYQISGNPDRIFVFDKKSPQKDLRAWSVRYESAIIEWEMYNHSANKYDAPFLTDTGAFSKIEISSNQGYRVIIKGINSGSIDTFRCWTIIDDFGVEITSTTNDTINEGNIFCGYIDEIDAKIDSVSLSYYNPTNNNLIELSHKYIPSWTSNYPKDATPPDNVAYGDPFRARVTNPYWKDTWYIFQATDNFGILRRDSAFYKSIQPHAEFKANYVALTDPEFYANKLEDTVYQTFYTIKDSTHSAPAIFRFTNLSENKDTCWWLFGDKILEIDSLKSNPHTINHTYNLPGTYYASLVATKKASYRSTACIDTFPSRGDSSLGTITINAAEVNKKAIKSPNVLVIGIEDPPGGMTYNHWRLFNDVSITEMEVTIYSRYGEKVHYFKGNIRDWDGWDGTRMGSNKYVRTGVYYYVIHPLNTLPMYDNQKNPDPNYSIGTDITRGFIHVFNKVGN